MFILGIPGGISAAVILGALMIHGLNPGMRLFRNNPEVIYTIMWGFLIANLMMGFVAAILARVMAYLTLFPRGILGPLILIGFGLGLAVRPGVSVHMAPMSDGRGLVDTEVQP